MGQKSSHEYTIIKPPKDFPDKTFEQRLNREFRYTDIDLTDEESELFYKVIRDIQLTQPLGHHESATWQRNTSNVSTTWYLSTHFHVLSTR